MRPETRREHEMVKNLLKHGYSLSKAIREVDVSWKTYYKYEDYILSNPEVLRPKRKLYVHIGPFLVDKGTDFILREVPKRIALRMAIRKYKRLKQLPPTTTEEILNEVNAKRNEVRRMYEEIKGIHDLIMEKSVETTDKLLEYKEVRDAMEMITKEFYDGVKAYEYLIKIGAKAKKLKDIYDSL